MRKVIIFRNELLPSSETFIKEQALALAGWQPVLVGYRRIANGLDLDGLQVKLLPGMNSGRVRRWRSKLQRLRGKPHKPTMRALKDIGADLLHAHFGTDATDIWPSARAAGLPMVVTLHGYDINIHREWWESGKGGWLRRAYPCRLLAMAQDPSVRFIAVSKAIKARAIEYGIPAEKITVAYIGIDTKRFTPAGLSIEKRPRRVLFVGRMVENKAPLLMIRAFAEVRRKLPDTALTMIGAGTLANDAKRLAAELNVPVDFMGACNSDEVIAQLHRASVLCLPSITTTRGDGEGFGLVLLEAQACGLPVVSSALGGAQEAFVNGKTGYSFAPGDLSAITACIEEVITDLTKAATMGRSARVHAKQLFDIRAMNPTLTSIYSEALRASQ